MKLIQVSMVLAIAFLSAQTAAEENEGTAKIKQVVRPYVLVFSGGRDSDADQFGLRVDLTTKKDDVASTITIYIERDGDKFGALFVKDDLPFLWVGPGLTIALDRVALGGLIVLTGGSIDITLPESAEKSQLTLSVEFVGKLGESRLTVDLRTIMDLALHRAKVVSMDRESNTVKMTNESGAIVLVKLSREPRLGDCPIESISMGESSPVAIRISEIYLGKSRWGIADVTVAKALKLDMPAKAGRLTADAIDTHCDTTQADMFSDKKAQEAGKTFAGLFTLPKKAASKEKKE